MCGWSKLLATMEEAYLVVKEGDYDYYKATKHAAQRTEQRPSLAMRFGNGVLPLVPMDGGSQLCDWE